MNPQPLQVTDDVLAATRADYEWRYSKNASVITRDPTRSEGILSRCRYGAPGDRLWVKENFATLTGNGIRTVYQADGGDPRSGWDDTPPERLLPFLESLVGHSVRLRCDRARPALIEERRDSLSGRPCQPCEASACARAR